MPAKPITLGSMYFKRRGDAKAYLKQMLNKYEVGDRVSAEDETILRAALAHHSEAVAKIGCGISSFSVRSADFGSQCFWVNRTDGTTEKFSISACIHSK
ncbi:DCL family protein [Hydrogenophaga sp. XSHU_21]